MGLGSSKDEFKSISVTENGPQLLFGSNKNYSSELLVEHSHEQASSTYPETNRSTFSSSMSSSPAFQHLLPSQLLSSPDMVNVNILSNIESNNNNRNNRVNSVNRDHLNGNGNDKEMNEILHFLNNSSSVHATNKNCSFTDSVINSRIDCNSSSILLTTTPTTPLSTPSSPSLSPSSLSLSSINGLNNSFAHQDRQQEHYRSKGERNPLKLHHHQLINRISLMDKDFKENEKCSKLISSVDANQVNDVKQSEDEVTLDIDGKKETDQVIFEIDKLLSESDDLLTPSPYKWRRGRSLGNIESTDERFNSGSKSDYGNRSMDSLIKTDDSASDSVKEIDNFNPILDESSKNADQEDKFETIEDMICKEMDRPIKTKVESYDEVEKELIHSIESEYID
ncbi:putative uncharacterized protein DDB_G0267840 [Tetranychus urticae]|uniref:putative uncharacterized protein DDB_G0267840 n=1 Tax=Tetranychus urticae TaxID=32264 RepID=UPI00077C04D0|nr:putative uncharacterized protein DDB_G0267840 [Tetranychus urticae]